MAEISMNEWTGSSRSFTRTATLSASTSSFSLRRRASDSHASPLSLTLLYDSSSSFLNADRFSEARWRIGQAFVPEYTALSFYDGYFRVFQVVLLLIMSLSKFGTLCSLLTSTVVPEGFHWHAWRNLVHFLPGLHLTVVDLLEHAWPHGSKLDANAKTWRLAADFMNDLDLTLNFIISLHRSIQHSWSCKWSYPSCFNTAFFFREQCCRHFCEEYGQEGSQETVATMVGMVLGMLLAHATIGYPVAIWFSFLTLTMFHLYGKIFPLS
ncbi:root UVB sensitive 3 protein [Nymphaea thermarum]|nr:root UVB sensitive 3 protein [Nymphaea thermarum]